MEPKKAPQKKLSKAKLKSLLIVVAVVVVAAGGYWLYVNRTDIFSRNSAARDVNGYIEIKDLGVKIKRTNDMKDWSFSAIPGYQGGIYIRTKAYSSMAAACQKAQNKVLNDEARLIDEAASSVYRQDTTYDTSKGVRFDHLAKQFDGYYIAFSGFGSNRSCKGTSQEAAMKSIADDVYQKALAAFGQAEAIPYTGPKLLPPDQPKPPQAKPQHR